MPSRVTYTNSTANLRNQTKIVDRKSFDVGLYGSQDPLVGFTTYEQRYNLEIQEVPIRTPSLARQLIEMAEHSFIVRSSLRYAANDAFASSDGSDRGFTISETMADGETPTPDDVIAVAKDLFSRRTSSYLVLGGLRLQKALKNALSYGNGYMELGIEREGISSNRKKDFAIAQTQFLPTWQMFNIQNRQGQQMYYEQRERLTDTTLLSGGNDYSTYRFPTWKIVDFCHDLDTLYGRSIWHTEELRRTWSKVKEADENLAIAAKEMAKNPNIHKLPPNTSRQQKRLYQDAHERHKAGRMITDYYVYHDADISKLQSNNSTLTPFIDNILYRQADLLVPGTPLYYFPTFSRYIGGARELSNQPALNYSRLRNSWCGILADGIRRALDVELYLRLGEDRYEELMGEFRNNMWVVKFPRWNVANYMQTGDETDDPYDDLDGKGDNVDTEKDTPSGRTGEEKDIDPEQENNGFKHLRRTYRKPIKSNSDWIYM